MKSLIFLLGTLHALIAAPTTKVMLLTGQVTQKLPADFPSAAKISIRP